MRNASNDPGGWLCVSVVCDGVVAASARACLALYFFFFKRCSLEVSAEVSAKGHESTVNTLPPVSPQTFLSSPSLHFLLLRVGRTRLSVSSRREGVHVCVSGGEDGVG